MTRAVVVWQWTDGRRGHERQCEGLVAALKDRLVVEHHVLPVPPSALRRGFDFLAGALPTNRALPDPDLIIGAGRRCGWPMLTARRARGGHTVCIMRPQLPQRWFDLCIIPHHDGVPPADNVIVSEGPLNPMRPAAVRETGLGVILLGGPSAHHHWHDEKMLTQIAQLRAHTPGLHWLVSDSRRSPPTLAVRLAALPDVEFIDHRHAPSDWLPSVLSRAAQVWVSADSVSMLYEALSAGANVGVLDVPTRRADRITAIAQDLCTRGHVMSLPDAARGSANSPLVLHEAERIAGLILARWPALASVA
jgi:uncharacterized protein